MDYNGVSKQISDLIGGRNTAQDQELANLQNQYKYQDTYNSLQGIRRNVSDTEKALSALPEQMQQRTAGSLVTSGQLGRLVNSESDPISKNLATLNQSQGLQQQGMTDINNLISQGQNRYQQSYQDQLGNLQNQQSQLFQAQENAKAQAQARANMAYQQQLSDAAAQKLAEQQQIASFKASVDNSRAGNNLESQGIMGPTALYGLIQNTTDPTLKTYAESKLRSLGWGRLLGDTVPAAKTPVSSLSNSGKYATTTF